ncbi:MULTISPECIES: aromatic-ring-hydroxylating dioxygenase subunit beta [unclassified Sphingomonas]|uniref:aromatic-ring-hydroxylating dioxygenase subunit beta n=1 Tax=unclassified Sphingomonas TaxID=196159 RepID=UPI0009259675|nr:MULTISPECIES: aromatic-ring-hydroxylating dioxygenase subunit beta [unclassified Sphingomonas]OJU18012.1 MAG: hypothetical protein BGN95_17475 [Sphingomonas sp. 66-10]
MILTPDAAAAILYREAECLDEYEWDAWLDLYAEDAVFWLPAWKNETETTSDPESELSLIYYRGRGNLADRVWRARSGQSVASAPRMRTVHLITNVRLAEADAASAVVASNVAVHLFDKRAGRSHAFFGRYRHELRFDGQSWLIAAKTIVLLNDTIPTVLDFYCI